MHNYSVDSQSLSSNPSYSDSTYTPDSIITHTTPTNQIISGNNNRHQLDTETSKLKPYILEYGCTIYSYLKQWINKNKTK